jgi:stage II sporulation protein AA (anti-sigma F factor antagonist)
MDIKTSVVDNDMCVMLIGELDEYSANYTRNYLDELFKKNNFENVIMDMSRLDFMDSTGIGVLLGRYKKLKENKKRIYIANPSNSIEKLIKMSGIYEIMPKI